MKDIGRVEVEAVRVKMAELEANMSGMQKGYEKKLRQAEESIRESSEKEVAEAVKARKEAEVEIMTLKSKIQTAYMEYRRAEI
jgi:histidinol dehydrogenase